MTCHTWLRFVPSYPMETPWVSIRPKINPLQHLAPICAFMFSERFEMWAVDVGDVRSHLLAPSAADKFDKFCWSVSWWEGTLPFHLHDSTCSRGNRKQRAFRVAWAFFSWNLNCPEVESLWEVDHGWFILIFCHLRWRDEIQGRQPGGSTGETWIWRSRITSEESTKNAD